MEFLKVDKTHMFGYVYFRQVKDKSLKRGYFQKVLILPLFIINVEYIIFCIIRKKSVVLLSKFPFISFYNYILALVATEYFTTGPEVIETGNIKKIIH